MKYRELIKQVQLKSGFSDQESRDSLQLLVETISVRLGDGELKDFASQLPQELQDIALTVRPSEENTSSDLLAQYMEIQSISQGRAKKQLLSAWEVLKQAISPGEIKHIKAQLPKATVQILH